MSSSHPPRSLIDRTGAASRAAWRTLLALGTLLHLVACGDVGERRAHLTVGTYWGGAANQTLHRELIRIAQDLGSVDIDVRHFSYAGLDDYLSKNQPREAQDTVDLAVVPSDWLGQLAQREIIGEVPSARVEAMRRKLVGQSLLAVSDGGQVLAFPLSADVDALVYDPGVFPSSPRTIDDVLSASLPPSVIPFALNLADPAQLAPFVSALQGSLVDRDDNLLWRDHDVVEALHRLRPAWGSPERWAACHGVDLESLQLQLFAEGKLASFVAGPWLLQALEDTDRPFRVIPIPKPAGAPFPARSLVEYQCLVVARETHWGDLALEVASRLLDQSANQRITRATRRLPVLMGAYEAQPAATSAGTFGFLHTLEEGQVLPPTARWSEGFARARDRLARLTHLSQPPAPDELVRLVGEEQP